MNLPNESTRTFVSLGLFIHLFCVAVVLSGNFLPSQLQLDLAKTVAIYTKTLHLDPGSFIPFQLTDGEQSLTQMHLWQVVDETGEKEHVLQSLPDSKHWRGGFGRIRGSAYAQMAAFYATNESVDDEVCAAMARAVAEQYLATDETTNEATDELTAKQFVVRCVRMPLSGRSDEFESATTVYAADVWESTDGSLNLLKRMEARRTAPPTLNESIDQPDV